MFWVDARVFKRRETLIARYRAATEPSRAGKNRRDLFERGNGRQHLRPKHLYYSQETEFSQAANFWAGGWTYAAGSRALLAIARDRRQFQLL